MDMVEMMEKAQAFSKLMHQEGGGEGNQPEFDYEKMTQMMQMMQIFSTLNSAPNASENKDVQKQEERKPKTTSIKTFDELTETPAIKSMKAAIPYLEYKYQKNIGVMVKLMEIECFLKNCQDVAAHSERQADWRKGMLVSLRPQMTEQKQQMMDVLIKFIDLKEMMDVLKKGGVSIGT